MEDTMEPGNPSRAAAYLTHELRAPLTAILAALQLLRERQTGDRERVLADLALFNAKRLNLLIDDVLDASKIQSGRMRIEPRPCDPARLARETALFLKPWAQRDGVSLTVLSEKGVPRASADPKRVGQALTNLISNALKFTPQGGSVTVSVSRGRRERAGFVVFSVKDTGKGVAPEEQDGVFRYFVQGSEGEDRGDGTGLGLPLARSMVELMGGEMWLESVPGRGATFFFSLPVHVEALPRTPAAPARLPIPQPKAA